MASTINTFAFLQDSDGKSIFYHNNKPVIDSIDDIGLDYNVTTDSNGDTWYNYRWHDDNVHRYVYNLVSPLITTTPQSEIVTYDVSDIGKDTLEAFGLYKGDSDAVKIANAAKKASDNQNSVKASVLNTTRAGYGTTKSPGAVKQMANNTGIYGGGTSGLIYPSDLLDDNLRYNGCYTVFFISEHQDSKIYKKAKSTGNISKAPASNIASSKIGNVIDHYNPQLLKVLVGLGVTTGVYQSLKAISSVFNLGVGENLGSTGVALTLSGGAAAAANNNAYSIVHRGYDYKYLNVAIVLPTPAITDNHELRWREGSTAVGIGALEAGKELSLDKIDSSKLFSVDGVSDEVKKVFNNVKNFANGAGGEIPAAIALGASELGIGTTLQAYSAKSANPRMEQLFDGVGFRRFSMSWNLAAQSPKDMENIESIIRVLKYHAYPELTPHEYMWIYPAHFDIIHYYRNGVNTHMPRHATSVLQSVDVDYSGGQDFISVHHDGSPVNIRLTLNFLEIAVLDRRDIANGY